MTRMGPSVDGSLSTLLVVGVGVLMLSFGALSQPSTTATRAETQGPNQPGAGPVGAGPIQPSRSAALPGGASPGQPRATGEAAQPGSQAPGTSSNCATGRNGGSTDRGVTGDSIALGATVVSSGIGASFLGPVRIGMEAVKNSVNRAGGVCGRKLKLKLVDDGWDAQRGQSYLRNLIEGDKVFALAVNPSSEGLRLASNEGYFAKTRTPVVGTDGMLNSQYVDPWVWPVAASTVSTMHIMAHDAYTARRARRFAIVYDSKYHFGVEGAFAFNAAVKRLTGKDIPGYYNPDTGASCTSRFCAIEAGRASYATEHKAFDDACISKTQIGTEQTDCDFIALLLEPNEALTFLGVGFTRRPESGLGLAQTLFSRSFALSCKSTCDGAVVWTGFNPPVGSLAALPAVADYVTDVRSVDPNVDVENQFLQGGYSGMKLLVAALTKVGPGLTRDLLKSTLDSMTYDNGLSTPMRWQPGNHFANASMRGFSIQYSDGFNGFRSEGGWVKDPWLGLDTKGSGG